MEKSRRKVIIKTQLLKMMQNGEWKNFVDSVIEKGCNSVNTKKINGYTLLSCATEYGDKEIVEYLIKNGASSSATNFDGSIPLHVAAKHNHQDLLEFFINLSVFVDSRDRKNRTSLHYVTDQFYIKSTELVVDSDDEYYSNTIQNDEEDCVLEEEHEKLASFLVCHGADIEASDSEGYVPVLLAAMHFCEAVVQMLVRRGANIQCCDENMWTVLHYASSRGWLDVVKCLVERKVDLNVETIRGKTSLLLAAENSHGEVVKLLVKSGANVSSRDMLKTTALHIASEEGWLNVVQLLVEYNADVNAKTCSGTTSVMLAVKHEHSDIFNFLVKSGADLVGCEGKTTILHYACEAGWDRAVQLIVDRGSDIDAQSQKGETPLLIAAKHSSQAILDILLKSGASLHICQTNSPSLLHYACRNGWIYIVQRLVDAGFDVNAKTLDSTSLSVENNNLELLDYHLGDGADINAKTFSGITSVMLAVKHQHWDIFNFLVKCGADLVGSEGKTTILHYACEAGWVKAVQLIVDRGSDIDAQTQDGDTPLLIAAKHADKDILDVLLNNGASLRICKPNYLSLLHYACINGWIDFVQRLVDAGWDINSKTPDGRTSLMFAAENDHLRLLEYLLEAGADINAKTCGATSVMFAVKHKHWDIFNFLIKSGADLVGSEGKTTILHYACKAGWVKVVQSIVDSGLNIDAQTRDGETPFLIAAKYSHKAILDLLLKSGASLDIGQKNSALLLHYSCRNGWIDVVQRLVDAGWDINTKAPDGKHPLMVAVEYNHLELLDFLLAAGADINAKMPRRCYSWQNWTYYENSSSEDDDDEVDAADGWKVLHYASYSGQLPLVLFLINKGAHVNVKTSKGITPLHIAAKENKLEVAMSLLNAGADIDAKACDGVTPIFSAVYRENLEIVTHLLKAGADVNVKQRGGTTQLYIAVRNGNVEITKHLLKAGANCNMEFKYYVKRLYDFEELMPLFIESGAYIRNNIYDSLIEKNHFKEAILTNVDICTQAILNKFNNLHLQQLYNVPFAVKTLPPLEKMKLGSDSYLAHCIKEKVVLDIANNGYCNITKIRPMVLSVLAVKAFIEHHKEDIND